jgi:hypothetical protein
MSAEKRRAAIESVKKNITYLMVLQDKTLPDLANYLDISLATLRRKVEEPRRWTLDDLISLANLFNVSVGLIIAGEVRFEKEVLRA